MSYTRRNTTDGVTIMNKDLYDNLQDGIEQFGATPQMYSAKGDGITDDTLAIQKLFDNHEVIYIPKGVYKITSPILVQHNVNVTGVNAELFTEDCAILSITDCSCTITGVTFNSNCVSMIRNVNTDKVYPFNYFSFSTKNTTAKGIVHKGSYPLKLYNCKFIGFYVGVSCHQNCEFHNCRFSYCSLCVEEEMFDPFFWDCYFTMSEQGILMSNPNYNTLFIYSSWFDQIGKHAIGNTNTSIGGYINATFDQIGESAICAKAGNRLLINGRFSRCGMSYANCSPDLKNFTNGEQSSCVHFESSANQVCIQGNAVSATLPKDSLVDPLFLSVRTGYLMNVNVGGQLTKYYSGVNNSNSGTFVCGTGIYKIAGVKLTEVGGIN